MPSIVAVDVHVCRLRKKLGACPGTDELIFIPIRVHGEIHAAELREEPGMSRRLFWKIFLPFWVAQGDFARRAVSARLHYRISARASLVDPA